MRRRERPIDSQEIDSQVAEPSQAASSRETIRLGTRGSKLALIQAHTVRDLLSAALPETDIQIVPVKTSGDKGDRDVLGAFVKEIQESLLAGEIDLALHCLKDLPTRPIEGLCLAAYLEREVVVDSLITRGEPWDGLALGAVVGTGSVRRTSQLAALRPDLEFKPLVGNVDTRMRKLQEGEYDAIVLASAGLKRLGVLDNWKESEYGSLHTEPLTILPAPGQAILVLEARQGSPFVQRVSPLNHPATESAAKAERGFMGYFGTGCSLPVAAFATIECEEVVLEGLVAAPNGSTILQSTERGLAANAEEIGIELAKSLCALGARELLTMGKA